MTDYFKMMRNVAGSYGDGFVEGREQRNREEDRAYQRTLRDRDTADYTRKQGIQTRNDVIDAEAAAQLDGSGPVGATAPTSYNMGAAGDNAVAEADALTDTGPIGAGLKSPARREMGAAANVTQFDPTSPAGQAKMLSFGIRKAVNEGRHADAAPMYAKQRELGDEEFFATSMKSYKGSPEQIEAGIRHLNQNSKSLTITDPDKNGFVRLTIAMPGGKAEYLKLNRQEQATLFAAGELMDRNPTKAMQMMEGVNKNLAAALAAENGLTGTLAANANDIAGKSAAVVNQRGMLGVAQQNANTQEQWRKDQAEIYRSKAGAGLRGADGKIDATFKRDALKASWGDVNGAEKEYQDVLKSEAQNPVPPNKDGTPAPTSEYRVYAEQRIAQARQRHLVTQLQTEDISPQEYAAGLIGKAKSLDDVNKHLTQTSNLMGQDYADGIAELVARSDKFASMRRPDASQAAPVASPIKNTLPLTPAAQQPMGLSPGRHAVGPGGRLVDTTSARDGLRDFARRALLSVSTDRK